jgi:phosphoribosylformylglycinamidine synthase
MAFTSDYGIDLWLRKVPKPRSMRRNDFVLFSESNSRFLVEVPEEKRQSFEGLMNGIAFSSVGRVRKDARFCVYGLDNEKLVDISLDKLRKAWKSALKGGGSQ